MDYLIALFGSIIWNYALFSIAKNKCDAVEMDFPYRKYLKFNWDNWLLTALCAPVLVWYLADIVSMLNYLFTHFNINVQLPMLEVYYLGAGVLSELILFGIFKLFGLKESLVAPVHKS